MNRSARSPRVAILGLGLIGGSLGLALRRRGIHVSGYDSDSRARKTALRRGAIDRAGTSIADTIVSARIIVLCAPVQAMPALFWAVGRLARPGTVITDVASVKVGPARWAARSLPHPDRFVGGHPMAGSERSGVGAATPDLFRGRVVVLTPTTGVLRSALTEVKRLWRWCGANPFIMDAARHDAVAAAVSHVPHALAVTLAGGALRESVARRIAAGGFMDATRVAASSPALWEGIFRANAGPLVRALKDRQRREQALIRAIESPRPAALRAILRDAAVRRRALARARAGTGTR